MKEYCIYLRKSRADAEAEARGEGETLARHEKALLELAERQKLNVTKIYREVVSGETIAARPVMQQVLSEVEQGAWSGVLVMEVERLARGDTIDQGIIAQTFKFSDTQIITPMKTYDPENEFDEEYFEFGLFMSRREYKTINRRLQRGRVASVKEGKYVANQPPYGYVRKKLEHDKGFTLAPHPEQAEIVRLIFEWYTVGVIQANRTRQRLGVSRIARKLNEMQVLPQKSEEWVPASIRDMLINPVYIGKVRWNWRPAVKRVSDGRVSAARPRASVQDIVIADGLHTPLISEETFQMAQEMIEQNRPAPVQRKNTVKNPLAGLVICGKCGRRMVRRSYTSGHSDTLMCAATSCDNVSASLPCVESRILEALREWLGEYRLSWESQPTPLSSGEKAQRTAVRALDAKLEKLEKQLSRVHELLEQGEYDVSTYRERSQSVKVQMEQVTAERDALQKEYALNAARAEIQRSLVPKVERLLEVYEELPTPKAKNDLLKEVLEKVVYSKERGGRWHSEPDNFELIIYPKLPEYE